MIKKNIFVLFLILMSVRSFGSFHSFIVKTKNNNIPVYFKKSRNFKQIKFSPFFTFESEKSIEQIQQEMQTSYRSDVEFIEPNYPIKVKTPNINKFLSGDIVSNWALSQIGISNSWDKTIPAFAKIKVGVIDSGIDWNHPALKDSIYQNFQEIPDNGLDDDHNGYIDDVHGFNFINHTANSMDDNGHGTHVAGLIGANCNSQNGMCGVSHKVKLIPLKFLDQNGKGDTQNAVEAIYYCIKMKVKIINASWGNSEKSEALFTAIDQARKNGILFVTAAGNYTNDNDQNPIYPSSFPLSNIISVAASDESDHLVDFSDFGQTTVHVAAP